MSFKPLRSKFLDVDVGNATITYPLLETLTDNFDDSSIDITKWNYSYTANATISETTQIELALPAAPLITESAEFNSVDYWQLKNSYFYIKVPQVLKDETFNNITMQVGDTNTYTIGFSWDGGSPSTLSAVYTDSGGSTIWSTQTYNSTTMKWWKISESGGNIDWWVSSDGITWNSFIGGTTDPSGFDMTKVTTHIIASTTAGNTDPGTAYIDNFNVAGVAATATRYPMLASLGVG